MAEKLFTPEDFDKPVDIPWYKKNKNLIIIVVCLVIVAILSYLWYRGHKEEPVTPEQDNPPTAKVDTTDVEGIDSIVVEKPKDSSDVVDNGKTSKPINAPDENSQNDNEKDALTRTVTKRGESLEVDAKMTIRGDYGNGHTRKANLGADYQSVQSIVNQRIREGKIYW